MVGVTKKDPKWFSFPTCDFNGKLMAAREYKNLFWNTGFLF